MSDDTKSEKVSVNISSSVLAQIDLLVDNNYFLNRSDFITQALNDMLGRYANTVDRIIEKERRKEELFANGHRRVWFIGVANLSKDECEEAIAVNGKISISGYGVLVIDRSCPDDLVFKAVDSIKVRGKVKCSPAVKEYYKS